jgi:hypothetical protein
MRAFRAKISRKRAGPSTSSSESHASADQSHIEAKSLEASIKGAPDKRDPIASTTQDVPASGALLARPKGTLSKDYSIDTCLVLDVPLEIEYISGPSRTSADEYSLSLFAVPSQSPRLPCTQRTERAFQGLKNAVQTFEHQYAMRKLNSADSTEWDDESITTALRQATQGTVFEASRAFGKAIETTVTKGANTVEEKTKRRSISGFVGKLFPLLKVLLSVGEAAAQVYPVSRFNLNYRALAVFPPLLYCVVLSSSWR